MEEHSVPSTPPPLPSVPSLPIPWWQSPPLRRSGESSRINWSAILASLAVSFALIVSILAWIVTHPSKAAVSLASPSIIVAVTPANLSSASVPPAPHRTAGIETIPLLHRPDRLETITNPLPLIEETPPPLPPPVPHPGVSQSEGKADPAAVQAAPHPAGETYGTQVLFLNNQAAAADMARHDHKLLFVMHISGNFEDSCFT